jgi:hypothetical protein
VGPDGAEEGSHPFTLIKLHFTHPPTQLSTPSHHFLLLLDLKFSSCVILDGFTVGGGARYDVEESPQLVVPSVEANEPTMTAPDEGPYDELPVIFDETSHHTSES